jgi:hypothetical protein
MTSTTTLPSPNRTDSWPAYRSQVTHPATMYKPADLMLARENLSRFPWAGRVVEALRRQVALTLAAPDETAAGDGDAFAAYAERMISATTPGGAGFTNCAACGANAIHGAYHWRPDDPDRLTCTTCGGVYPDARYPEDVVFRAERHGNGQVISYHGGYHFDFRGFALYSSWSAQIRARKVAYMAGQAQALATLYALTGDSRSAAAARAILLRFAAVYPGYLVHSSYGEWIDLPPRLVAARINDLPEDEWTIPPNRPDRKLHSGYWNSGRATGSGMEGTFVRQVAIAYDLLHDALSDDERLLVERDLLLESTVLLLADPARNNKSVANLTAAGLVGMAVGDPGLVRAGAGGFWHFVRNWFLPDGTTSESPAYGLMTLNGLWSFGEALHGYSDPAGYAGDDRLEGVDVYADPAYRAVFRALYDTLLPDLRYPAFADSYVTTTLGTRYAELMATRYDEPAYQALLTEVAGGDPDASGGEFALFHRRPARPRAGAAEREGGRVAFQSRWFPALHMAYLRAGRDGRGATAILSTSHWGGHHHRDSLNLILYQQGHEVLTDLGYLWDRPDKDMTVRTPAHNLVVVDAAEQRTAERGGHLHLFEAVPGLAVAVCSSAAYAQATCYRRTCLLVDLGAAGGAGGAGAADVTGSYLVDVFWVSGGQTHDYLFHGPVPGYTAGGIALARPSGAAEGADGQAGAAAAAPYGIARVQTGTSPTPWRLTWHLDPATRFTAWALPHGPDAGGAAGETVIVGDGWGERGWGHFNSPDKKVDVPYVVRRRAVGSGARLTSAFVSVFEISAGPPLVRSVRRLPVTESDVEAAPEEAVALEVESAAGTQAFLLALSPGRRSARTTRGALESDGTVTVAGIPGSAIYRAGGR